MPTLRLRQFQIHYEVIEQAVPYDTLFVHGNLASGEWWRPTLHHLKKPNRNGRAILMDWLGCGQSEAPKAESDMAIEKLGQDCLELLNALKIKDCHGVGHSTGGLILAMAMAMEPERFRPSVLLDPVGATGIQFDNSVEQAFLQMAENKELAGAIVGATIKNHDIQSSFHQEVVTENAFKAAKSIGLFLLNNLKNIDQSEKIKALTTPTLILHGSEDQVLPINDSRKLASLMKNGHFEEVVGQGHCWNVENPAAFAERISRFMFS